MIESRKFVAVGILVGLALIIAGLILSPSNSGAHAAANRTDVDAIADRIGGAFAAVSEATADPTLADVAAAPAPKGDREISGCAAETWPNIDAGCLATTDGRPAHQVRTITVGYQANQSTTVLLRIPSEVIAQR